MFTCRTNFTHYIEQSEFGISNPEKTTPLRKIFWFTFLRRSGTFSTFLYRFYSFGPLIKYSITFPPPYKCLFYIILFSFWVIFFYMYILTYIILILFISAFSYLKRFDNITFPSFEICISIQPINKIHLCTLIINHYTIIYYYYDIEISNS